MRSLVQLKMTMKGLQPFGAGLVCMDIGEICLCSIMRRAQMLLQGDCREEDG